MEHVQLAPELIGDRIILRKHRPECLELMFNTLDEDRERLRKFLPWVDFTKTIEDTKAYYDKCMKNWDNCEHFDYGIFAKDGDFMGNIGVHNFEWNHDSCEIGYWIAGKYEGQGFMSEAVKVLEKEIFTTGLNRIEIRCSTLNDRSRKVPERCGYTHEGTLRQNSIEYGEFRDTFIFSKLQSEFLGKQI